MTDSAKILDQMMRENLQAGGYAVAGGSNLYMEVMDTATGQVWMSAAAVQVADFEALELEPSLVKVGIARASMDRAPAYIHVFEPALFHRDRLEPPRRRAPRLDT